MPFVESMARANGRNPLLSHVRRQASRRLVDPRVSEAGVRDTAHGHRTSLVERGGEKRERGGRGATEAQGGQAGALCGLCDGLSLSARTIHHLWRVSWSEQRRDGGGVETREREGEGDLEGETLTDLQGKT